ncbi:gamma-crystallin M2-like [Denticeps clupeoides]|uniref:Beta/gamma crystallin 'Greek key' domain-containing protein n=1 Tax=Denticeps clupeoides TaxID=299321 RepID=A0AAY4E393_9TELE|nr:gamma-crystallin M2-like [Denticeps clupeoides]
MSKIIFYEGRNFEGRHFQCSSDCADTHSHFSRCNSIRVDSGCWVAYEKPNYGGYQYILSRGKYPDHHRWAGFNNCIRSCRMIPAYSGNYRLKMFERSSFSGKVMELADDCPSLQERFQAREISSCNVMDGYWILYEHPHYRGRQYILRPGEYRDHVTWGSGTPSFGSVRRITELKQ